MASGFSVFITGCNRGLGLGLVKTLLKKDNSPNHIFASTRKMLADDELSSMAAAHDNLHIIQMDVTEYSMYPEIVRHVGTIVKDAGLNLLINNAAVLPDSRNLESVTPEDMRNAFEVNCVAPIFLSKAFLPLIQTAADKNDKMAVGIKRAGIVQISTIGASISSFNSMEFNFMPYRCSKSALNMAMRSMSLELVNSGILTLALHPGWVQTDMGGPDADIRTETSSTSIVQTLDSLTCKHHGTFLQYDSTAIEW